MMTRVALSGSSLYFIGMAALLAPAFCQAQTLTTLVAFTGANGAPYLSGGGGLVQGADGNFYGTTNGGGSHNLGTIFKVTPAGALTTLYNFGSTPTDGTDPAGALIQASDGNFYGTTNEG
jgi:uncharacterized repeat protein (TIGR03803 family)